MIHAAGTPVKQSLGGGSICDGNDKRKLGATSDAENSLGTSKSAQTREAKIFETVLVVDPDQALLKLIRNHLNSAGSKEIECFSDGSSALEEFQKRDFQLAIIDWKLGSPSGFEVLKSIRASPHNRDVPVVMISGAVTGSDLLALKGERNITFLLKPFTEAVLIEAIRRAFGTMLRARKRRISASSPDSPLVEHINSSQTAIDTVVIGNDPSQATDSIKDEYSILAGRDSHSGPSTPIREVPGQQLAVGSAQLGKALSEARRPAISSPASGRADEHLAGVEDFDAWTLDGDPSTVQTDYKDHLGVNLSLLDPDLAAETSQVDVSIARPFDRGEAVASQDDQPRGALFAKTVIRGCLYEIPFPSRVLVADADSSIVNVVSSYLNQLGASSIVTAESGSEAWSLASKHRYDLIVVDWKMRYLSGLGFYHRLRSNPLTADTNLIVLAGNMRSEDFRVITENRYTRMVPKPILLSTFTSEIRTALIRSLTYKMVIKDLGRTVMSLIEADLTEVVSVIKDMSCSTVDPVGCLIAAIHILIDVGRMDCAENLIVFALTMDPKNITLNTELAKIMHTSGRSKDALSILERMGFDIESIERLCLLGELGLTFRKPDQAHLHFKAALGIDSEHEVANAGIKIAGNLAETLEQIPPISATSVDKLLASTLNAVGIAYARARKVDRAVEQYKCARCFVKDRADLSKLTFNMGLAYLRAENFGEAYKAFKAAAETAPVGFSKPALYAAKFEAPPSPQSKVAPDDTWIEFEPAEF